LMAMMSRCSSRAVGVARWGAAAVWLWAVVALLGCHAEKTAIERCNLGELAACERACDR
jgi:hypothetical protein